MLTGLRIAALFFFALATGCSSAERAPDFVLRDDGGNAWMLSRQRGRVVLLTFGFTHCADTCPATVAKLARLGLLIPSGARTIVVGFVTVDPQRDTVAALHRFVTRFASDGNARVVGLTGTVRQIEQVKREYHVWSAPTARGDIAHSAVIFVIDPEGRIRGISDDDESESTLVRSIRPIAPSS